MVLNESSVWKNHQKFHTKVQYKKVPTKGSTQKFLTKRFRVKVQSKVPHESTTQKGSYEKFYTKST